MFTKFITASLGVSAMFALSACATMELSGIPITSVSSTGNVMQGEITPRTDFTSSFALTEEETGVVCQGQTGANGQGNMSCTDGRNYEIHIPDYPGFNGSYVATYDQNGSLVGANDATELVAVGYGDDSDIGLLTGMLP